MVVVVLVSVVYNSSRAGRSLRRDMVCLGGGAVVPVKSSIAIGVRSVVQWSILTVPEELTEAEANRGGPY